MDINEAPQQNPINKNLFLKVVVGFSAMFALMTSILLFISKLLFIKDKLFLILFYSSIESYHISKIVYTIFYDATFKQYFIQKFIFNPDLHMMILSLCFISTDNTNLFYILDYIICTAVDFLIFFFKYIVPGMKLYMPELEKAKVSVQSPNFQLLSAFFEMIVAIFLLIHAIVKHKKRHWSLFVAYFLLVNLSGVITSEYHSIAWDRIINYFRQKSLQSGGLVGRISDTIADLIYSIKLNLQKLYPRRELKIHFE